ncbi:MAG: hypothetical protein ABI462_02605, partial [Ignavibacteria bacterium]
NKIVSDNNSEYQKNKINYENNLQQLEKLSSTNASYLIQIEEIQSERNKAEELLKGLSVKLKEAEKVLKQKEHDKKILGDRLSEKEKEISSHKTEQQILRSKIGHLISLSENFEDYAEGVRFLIKDLKEKNILTILDAIEVEDKFKIAIETALGEVSNYIIVNDSLQVDKLIDMLDENKKGKVTFILNDILNYKDLDHIAFLEEDTPFTGAKGVYGFADKFVKCIDDRHLLLMRYILDEYVIVDNLATAKKLSEDNYYKFITLGGDIISRGFIRSGGEVNEESVRMVRQKKLNELEEDANRIGDIITKHEDELKKIMSDHELISIEVFRNNFNSVSKECEGLEKQIEKLDFKKGQLNSSISENEDLYNEINGQNRSLNEIINACILEVNRSENDQYNLDKELIFLTEEFNVIEQGFTEDSADYNNFNLEFIKIKNELRNEEQSLSNLSNLIFHNETRSSGNLRSIEETKVRSEELTVTVVSNKERLAVFQDELRSIDTEYISEKKIADDTKSHQHKVDIEQRQRRIDFDSVSQKLINAQIKIKENEIKSEQIMDYILKKYEISVNDLTLNREDYGDSFDFTSSKIYVEELSEKLKRLGGGYQQILFEDFENEKAELEKLIEQKDDLIESEKDIRKTIEKINKEARERFLHTFEKIRENFITIFKELFSEGDEANLRIVYEEDEDGKLQEDPLEAKIEIIAKPRGKRPTSIELLSGGEKTLTAIALLFAIYLVKPSPFCVLDEVDAPLDVANLSRFNKMIRKFSDNTQFILITHNERTMESVDRLYGVTMQEAGITTIVETKFKTDEKLQA